MNEWFLFSLIFASITTVVVVTNWLHKKTNIKSETIRKFIHVCVGLVVSICPFIFKSNIQLILLSLLFIGLNSITIKFNLFQSINSTSRKSLGTIFFPFSILILSFFFWEKPISLILSVLVMTLADPLATIIGKMA